MHPFLKSISLLLVTMALAFPAFGADYYPLKIGDVGKAEMMIEMPKAYASGFLIMVRENGSTIKGSLVNEFGISLIDFTYDENKNKIKLQHVVKMLDRWFIKRTLKADLSKVLTLMRTEDVTEYFNTKQKINYKFYPLNETAE